MPLIGAYPVIGFGELMTDPHTTTSQIAVCPRCGTRSAGVAWCTRCGRNLRGLSQSQAAPGDPARPYSREPAHDNVYGSHAAAIVVAAIVALIAVVIVLTGASGKGQTPPSYPADYNVAASQPSPYTSESPTTETPSVASTTVEQVLDEYERDYSEEDIEGLRHLFSEDLVRQDGTKPSEDLAEAQSTYEKQFSELSKPVYTLSELRPEPGHGEANADAQYSITSQNGTVHGSIAFHLIEQNGQLLIDHLTITPSK